MSITIGQVSGIIAAAVFVVQFIFPNALVLIIVSILGNDHNAVTWSVVSRHLLSSNWPFLLRSDTAAGAGVNIGVRILGIIQLLGVIIIAVAAIVTPLGLHENIVATKSNVQVPFTDLVDTSPMGVGTPGRSALGFSRSCGNFQPLACPGSKTQVDLTFDSDNSSVVIDSEIIGTYDMHVPDSLIDLYQSGLSTQPETVSSFFDIQTRQWTEVTNSKKLNGEPYVVDSFRMLESVVLNDAIEAKEGLVVDTKEGRIAFRHHRTPQNVGVGAEWTEDLLFLQPYTECVDLNLTLEFTVPPDGRLSEPANLTLIDNGGFSKLVQEYPTMNVTTSQEDPNLHFRAYKAAWLTTVYSMLIMNVTRPNPDSFAYLNSEPGKRFELAGGLGAPGSLNSIKSDPYWKSLVDPDNQAKSNFTSTFTNETTTTGIYDNPFNITGANYTDISILCQGAGGADTANSSNVWVQCGLIYSAARRKDGQESLIFRGGDVYEQSVYSCASVTRASIKTVSFRFNTTTPDLNLKSLTVTNITDKTYSDEKGPNPPPLWGIETLNMSLVEVQQLWGLISDDNADAPNMTAIRAPHLHLPGFNLAHPPPPAYTAITEALVAMYDLNPTLSTGNDYTGAGNLALFQKWQGLSKTPEGVARMLNIVWTDVAANLLTGTRGWGTGKNVTAPASRLAKRQSSDDAQQTVLVPVRLFERRVQYHWPYAIPAFAALALFASTLALSCCCAVLQRGGAKRTKYYMNHLSAGRLLAEQRFPGAVDKQVDRTTWVKMAGKRSVALREGGPGLMNPAVGGEGIHGAYSPYIGAGGGEAGGYMESKPLASSSATELHQLHPAGGYSPSNGQGYVRMQNQ
ncbi:uncharacterized protein AB675_6774 [Cyphellophora attinorum]|uniref:Uncharacterized protein n=1 Tax=Cyphellophora attinorum TaxID=1664694 RepID=A0A0N0NPX9_9EURO|nr:uncharacterized protein AB675_6774 [Phialophora attinorum]KPI43258.1 hypothetical protein AB675_6774 [Phialophora attinorum]